MDEEKPHSLRGLITRMVCMLFALLLLLYPLSIGPAVYYIEKHYYLESHPRLTSKDFIMFNRVYYPVLVVVGKVPFLTPPFERYLKFWKNLAVDHAYEEEP